MKQNQNFPAADDASCYASSVVDVIRRYNRWRRGDESLTMESPKAIGDALDAVCDRIGTLEKWVEEGKRNGARCAEERDRLQDAVRDYRNAKGRYHTQKACERLLALVPANVEVKRGEYSTEVLHITPSNV